MLKFIILKRNGLNLPQFLIGEAVFFLMASVGSAFFYLVAIEAAPDKVNLFLAFFVYEISFISKFREKLHRFSMMNKNGSAVSPCTATKPALVVLLLSDFF